MKRFTKILASLSTQSDDRSALQHASLLAEHNKASLTLVSVVPDLPWHARLAMKNQDDYYQSALSEELHRLEQFAEPIKARGVRVTFKALRGQSSVEIIREVQRNGHDLVVRANKGDSSKRSGFFGATSLQLMRKCPCPVWIVKQGCKPVFQRVLGSLDLAHDEVHVSLDREIIELARSIAEREGGKCEFTHVWDVYGEQMLRPRMSDDEWEQLTERTKSEVLLKFRETFADCQLDPDSDDVHLVRGEPARAIPKFVEDHDVDLLIMGTVGRSGLSGMIMGNTAEMILDRVQCPVLALKPESFTSPIVLGDAVDEGAVRLGEATP